MLPEFQPLAGNTKNNLESCDGPAPLCHRRFPVGEPLDRGKTLTRVGSSSYLCADRPCLRAMLVPSACLVGLRFLGALFGLSSSLGSLTGFVGCPWWPRAGCV